MRRRNKSSLWKNSKLSPPAGGAKSLRPLSKRWTYFEKIAYGKKKIVTFHWRNLIDSTLTKWQRLTSLVMSCGDHPSPRWYERHFTCVVFFPKTCYPNVTIRKTSDKSKLKDILQHTSMHLKIVKVVKNKVKTEKHRPQETKKKR